MSSEKVNRKNILLSLIWKTLEKISTQLLGIVIQVILVRILEPKDFASMAIMMAIINFASIFVQSGLATAIVQKKNLENEDVSSLAYISLMIAAIIYMVIFVASPYIANYYQRPELKITLRILSIILFLYAFNAIQTALLQRKMLFKKLFYRNLIATLLSGLIGIVMAYGGYSLWSLVAYYLSNAILTVIIFFVGEKMRIGHKFSIVRAKEMYSFSGKLLFASLVSGSFDTLRTMVVGRKYSAEALAFYDKAYTYSSYLVQTIGYSISSVMLPVFSRQQEEMDNLRNTARKAIQLSAFIMFPILFGGIGVSEALIETLFTKKWLGCATFFSIFCVLRLPECMITIDKQVYFALKRGDVNLYYEIALFILNTIVLLVCMRKGILSIAIGAALVEVFAGCIIAVMSQKLYCYRIGDRLKDICKPLLNSIIMLFIVKILPIFYNKNSAVLLIIQVIIGFFVYVFLAIITKDINYLFIRNKLKAYLTQTGEKN